MKKPKRISGTKEWANVNRNCVTGCKNGCRYCYAAWSAVERFGIVKPGEWTNEHVRWADARKKMGKIKGTVMFPTTHDISPNNLEACLECIGNILEPGNNILIVSKPHSECIKAICEKFVAYADKILFRFTIGAMDNWILQHWEPNAPPFEERLKSLKLAYDLGFKTSVSMEPLLEAEYVDVIVATLTPYVTDAIWIGKMNKIEKRVKAVTPKEKAEVERIKTEQTDENIKAIYERLKKHPLIKWKESIKEVVGLELVTEAGADE